MKFEEIEKGRLYQEKQRVTKEREAYRSCEAAILEKVKEY